MGLISLPYSFSPNTLIESAKVNSNFTTIYAEFDGSITDANVSSLSESKVTFSGTGHAHNGGATGQSIVRRGVIAGLTMSVNSGDTTNDIDVAAGACRDKDDALDIILASGLTKRLDAAWAVGTNQGMLATGAGVTNTTYFIFVIRRPDTGVVDVAADTSATGANIATNTNAAYTSIRRIGALIRSGGANRQWVQYGDRFFVKDPTGPGLDVTASNPGTSAVTRTLNVPIGIAVEAIMNVEVLTGAGGIVAAYLSDLATTDVAAAEGATPLGAFIVNTSNRGGVQARIMTNTSGQIRSRLSFSDAGVVLYLQTIGWIDRRGRDD